MAIIKIIQAKGQQVKFSLSLRKQASANFPAMAFPVRFAKTLPEYGNQNEKSADC
jgi:hypothetical protein